MANCQLYQDLSTQEKVIVVGKLVHLFQNSDHHFIFFLSVLDKAEKEGKFNDVTILPDTPQQ